MEVAPCILPPVAVPAPAVADSVFDKAYPEQVVVNTATGLWLAVRHYAKGFLAYERFLTKAVEVSVLNLLPERTRFQESLDLGHGPGQR